ncbi:Calcium/calmodulin-dependent protein kinase type II subunit delta [Tetrabaena socialis]|uniref:Calcium/calmodulin-dependent protein kinase type II subunit delta n=1 Tax=Tetrabaena socialis TaxID=47790 RepID=A0A2J8A7E4_9CHLO|nr:Calcium/calmodulin-dependent protein kinase type II subunit delta [Tetrabaena socialis]|eukprot:PNH08438.1 Calcium/calmodulin-dependent protein kinase type II subunit delta [Tetrabaena socialis]
MQLRIPGPPDPSRSRRPVLRSPHRHTVAAAPRANSSAPSSPMAAAEVLALNSKLLDAIAGGDYETYATLCDPSLTCFEPEAVGHLIEGLDFHKFYFTMPSAGDASKPPAHVLNTMASPHVRVIGDCCAVVSYVRLTQKMVAGAPVTVQAEETRVWEKKDGGRWIHVHVHRSLVPK